MELKSVVEAALFVSDQPLSIAQIQALFPDDPSPSRKQILEVLDMLKEDYQQRPVRLYEVASGYCFQVGEEMAPWMIRLLSEKPARYSRALLETISIIAYRQPVTRGDIESIRGVAVSSNIIRTLMEREWVRIVGYKQVPGKPAIYATTRQFLDYFNLKSLEELPTLMEIQSIEQAIEEVKATPSSDDAQTGQTDLQVSA